MQAVWKCILDVGERQTISLPRGARLLYAREQGENVCVWALVDLKEVATSRTLLVYGTGHPIERAGPYLGSAHLDGGRLVFHVFEDAGE